MASNLKTLPDNPLERSDELARALSLFDPPREPPVLVFVGQEGLGKSCLLRAFRQRARDSRPGALVVRCDFKATAGYDSVDTLINLRRQVSLAAKERGHKVNFLAFDLAVCQYKRKTQGDAEAEKLEAILAGLSDPGYRSLILTAGRAAGALSIGILSDKIEQALRFGLRKARKEQAQSKSSVAGSLADLLALDSDELEGYLPGLMCADLHDYLDADNKRRVVFCMDDYGHIWGENESRQTVPEREPRDAALKALMEGESGATFVIADRSHHFWKERMDDDRYKRYAIVRLLPYSSLACRTYLERCGVPEPLRDGIVDQSHGLPFWLCLAVQQYQHLRSQGVSVTAAQLSQTGKDVIGIVQAGLTPLELQTLKHLSSALWFDQALFTVLVTGELSTGYPATAMDDFAKLSFVEECMPGVHAIHATFREPIRLWLESNARPLLDKLDEARRKHQAANKLAGAAQGLLEAEDSLTGLARRFKSNQISAPEFEKALERVFPSGFNPADQWREVTADSQARIKELQDSIAATEAALRKELDSGAAFAPEEDKP